jgi:hypothetical protein
MSVRIRKLPNKSKWRVYDGDKVSSKGTTKIKAEKQARLLRGVAHGMKLRNK